MIYYWDSNALVLLYVPLPGATLAQTTFRDAEVNLVSKLTILETYRTLIAMSVRKHITSADAKQAISKLRADHNRLYARSVDKLLQSPLLEKFLSLLQKYWKLGTNDVLHENIMDILLKDTAAGVLDALETSLAQYDLSVPKDYRSILSDQTKYEPDVSQRQKVHLGKIVAWTVLLAILDNHSESNNTDLTDAVTFAKRQLASLSAALDYLD